MKSEKVEQAAGVDTSMKKYITMRRAWIFEAVCVVVGVGVFG